MVRTSPTLRRATLAVSGLLVGALLTGCGGSSDPDDPDPSSADATTTPTATPDQTQDGSPSTTSTPTPAASDSPAKAGLAGRLLTAADLGATGQTWSQGRTGPAGAEPFGVCQRFDLATIGATRVVQRDFTAEDGTLAAQQIARFPDAMTAARAAKVIDSWRADCRKRQGDEHAKLRVREPNRVSVPVGTASWYLTSWVPADDAIDGHFQSFGTVLDEATMTLVTMDHDGQDHEQAPADDPMVAALQSAAQRMG